MMADADLSYSDRPPVLIAASSARAMARAERAVIAAGLRIGAKLPLESAKGRIEQQAAATGWWIELDRDRGQPMDDLLEVASRDAALGRYVAVVSTTHPLLDAVSAQVDEAIEIIVDAGDAERIAALAMMTSHRELQLRLADISGDRNAERLRQLSEEVNRIASTLARLSNGPAAAPNRPALELVSAGEVPAVSAQTVRNVIRARRLRANFLPEEIFADPAWDMLLDLLQAEIAQLRVPVSSLCIAAAVPATTALRWLKSMVAQGLFIRRADPHDGRRVFVELAPATSHALRRYFAEVGQVEII